MTRRVLAWCGLAAVLVIAPALLWLLTPHDLTQFWSGTMWRVALNGPAPTHVIVMFVCAVGWIAWAQAAVCIITEFINQLAGTRLQLPWSRRLQGVFRKMVAVALATGILVPTAAQAQPASVVSSGSGAPAAAASTGYAHTGHTVADHAMAHRLAAEPTGFAGPAGSTSADSAHAAGQGSATGLSHSEVIAQSAGAASALPGVGSGLPTQRTELVVGQHANVPTTETATAANATVRRVVVERGDTLWGLAEEFLGDGMRWRDIADLNKTVDDRYPGCVRVSDEDMIHIGWSLRMPDAATGLPAWTEGVDAAEQARGNRVTAAPSVPQPAETTTDAPADATTGQADRDQADNASNADAGDTAAGNAESRAAGEAPAANQADGDKPANSENQAQGENRAQGSEAAQGSDQAQGENRAQGSEQGQDSSQAQGENQAQGSGDAEVSGPASGENRVQGPPAVAEQPPMSGQSDRAAAADRLAAASEADASGDANASGSAGEANAAGEAGPAGEPGAAGQAEQGDTPKLAEAQPPLVGPPTAAAPPADNQAGGQGEAGPDAAGEKQGPAAGEQQAAEPPVDRAVPPAADAEAEAAEQAAKDRAAAEQEPPTVGVQPVTDGDAATDAAANTEPVDFQRILTVVSAGLLSAALAWGLLAVLRRRRKAAPVAGGATAAEPDIVATPALPLMDLEEQVEHLRWIMQDLASDHVAAGNPVPKVLRVTLDEDCVDVGLAEPAQPLGQWRAVDGTTWQLAGLAAHAVEREGMPDPYPALVTVGHDHKGRAVFVNLEQVQGLTITGDEDRCHNTMRALALEVATTPWSDSCQVYFMGDHWSALSTMLESVGATHIRDEQELFDLAEEQHRQTQEALAVSETTSAADHRMVDGDSVTEPMMVIFVSNQLSAKAHKSLKKLLDESPQPAVAVVCKGDRPLTSWVLGIDNGEDGIRGKLNPVGLKLRPQMMSDDLCAEVNSTMTPTAVVDDDLVDDLDGSVDDDDLPPSADESESDGLAAVHEMPQAKTNPEVAAAAAGAALTAANQAANRASDGANPRRFTTNGPTAPAAEPLRAVDSSSPGSRKARTIDVRDATGRWIDVTEPPAAIPDVAGPMVQLLGPVAVQNTEPLGQKARSAALTALTSYLVTQPEPVSASHISQSVWTTGDRPHWSVTTTMSYLKLLERWLGEDANGNPYISSGDNGDSWMCDGVPTDYDVFSELIGQDPRVTPTPRLWAGLHMVTGRPCIGQDFRAPWLADVASSMSGHVVKAAAEVADRCVRAREYQLAKLALKKGRMVDRTDQHLVRLSLTTLSRSDDRQGLERLRAEVAELFSGDHATLDAQTRLALKQVDVGLASSRN